MKVRLDQEVMLRGLAPTRSQAESYIRLGQVKVNGQIVTKAGFLVGPQDKLELLTKDQYVSRAALKLASVADKFHLDFRGKTVLDVGSSTGGFTDYALQHGALKVIAVDVGTDQLHFSLRGDQRVELHEKTDIRDYATNPKFKIQNSKFDIILADVSFISLRQILPHVSKLMTHNSQLMVWNLRDCIAYNSVSYNTIAHCLTCSRIN